MEREENSKRRGRGPSRGSRDDKFPSPVRHSESWKNLYVLESRVVSGRDLDLAVKLF